MKISLKENLVSTQEMYREQVRSFRRTRKNDPELRALKVVIMTLFEAIKFTGEPEFVQFPPRKQRNQVGAGALTYIIAA